MKPMTRDVNRAVEWPCEFCISGACSDPACSGGRQCQAALCTPAPERRVFPLRYVGQVQSWSIGGGGAWYAGAVYDTEIRRGEDTGNMAQDFGFVGFTKNFHNRARATEALSAWLTELNHC